MCLVSVHAQLHIDVFLLCLGTVCLWVSYEATPSTMRESDSIPSHIVSSVNRMQAMFENNYVSILV